MYLAKRMLINFEQFAHNVRILIHDMCVVSFFKFMICVLFQFLIHAMCVVSVFNSCYVCCFSF